MPPTTPQPQNYDFIVNPTPPPRRSPLADLSMPKRIMLVGGILIILFILFSVFKGLISGTPDVDLYAGIVEDQQEIIYIATLATQQQGLSTINTNSALTTKASITTDQATTIAYMQKQGKKTDPKKLAKTVTPQTAAQLKTSAEAGTYDQTYQSLMEQQLQAYARHLQQVYKQTSGKNGHIILDNNFRHAQLLLKQLKST